MVKKTKICIIGAGISGLSCAHELASRGFDVHIYEASDSIGGKAKSELTAAGYPCEHGFRIYSGYHNLFTFFSEIPTGESTTVMDYLIDRDFNLVFEQYNPIRYKVKRSLFRPINLLSNLYKTSKLFRFKEMLFFTKEILLFPFRSKQYHQQLKNMDFSSFLKREKNTYSPEFLRYIGDWTHIAWGAPPNQSAAYLSLDVLSKTHYRHANILNKELLFPMMNRPSSEAIFSHWFTLLKQKGVQFYFDHRVTDIKITPNTQRVEAFILRTDGKLERIEADYYVVALPVERAATILPRTLSPNLQPLSECVYRFNGVQLYLKGKYLVPNGITRYEDSPWGLLSCHQNASFWHAMHFAPPVTSILSTIISNWEKPGIVYQKPVTECSPDEIIDEIVAQINMHRSVSLGRTNVHDFCIDSSVKFSADKKRILDVEVKLYSTVAGMYDKQPDTNTSSKNIFLAGDYIRTDMHQGTMESACISGKLAANAVMKAAGFQEGFAQILATTSAYVERR